MIGPTGAVRVMMATKAVDFRKGAEGLAVLVREVNGHLNSQIDDLLPWAYVKAEPLKAVA